ncbi:helix-turn-helix domain-containing protein [uncultured Cycloclasticus sp.]|jgi:prophage regulatory protein|uniref:helix-turn-helix transcriptional regulator n=1 Tax=uncultured Cycloclasticus sp. TaxID=172194 RepID=UPI00258FB30E|nr:helix-turn-helix domain-containing protein [uncultured Cycloclasticus sp.]
MNDYKLTCIFLSVANVSTRYGIGVSTVWAWVKEGKLPSPYKFGDRCTRWKSSELDEFDLHNKVEV